MSERVDSATGLPLFRARALCVRDDDEGPPRVALGRRAESARHKGMHWGPVAVPGARLVAEAEGLLHDPYADTRDDLEIFAFEGGESPDDIRWETVHDVLADPIAGLDPAERFALRRLALDGTARLHHADRKEIFEPLEGVDGDKVAPDVWVMPLRTPTLPPAAHTNMVVVAGPGVVVDPGAHDPDERRRAVTALRRLAEIAGPLQALWLTHHHHDHVGAVEWLADRLDLPVWGHELTASRLGGGRGLDRTFVDGEVLPAAGAAGFSGWRALWTPGHAPGHLCLWHAETRRLVAGDMVAGEGTILIEPEDGDMTTYLESLERLADLEPVQLFPAHGKALGKGEGVLRHYIEHRLAREARILAAVRFDPRPVADVLREAYSDVAPMALPLAALSLESHLRRLAGLRRIRRDLEAATVARA